MKVLSWTGIVLVVIALGIWVGCSIFADYDYTNTISNYWTLADRASTIQQKSDYIDQFVSALQASGLQGTHDALFLATPENSFDSNFQALQSLQSRLHEIKTMDESSFAYQTAIQQITAQEQGQAQDMLRVFNGTWLKVHHYFLWNMIIGIITMILLIGVFVASLMGIVATWGESGHSMY